MTEMPALGWSRADRRRIDETFDRLRDAISGSTIFEAVPSQPPSRLDEIAATFALDSAELALLMVAAAREIRPDALAGHPATAGLAQSISDGDIWAALCPQGALRRWHILELEGAGPVGERLLRIDERMLHHLLGVDYLDARLEGRIEMPPDPPEPSADERALAADLARLWRPGATSGWPVLQLAGAGGEAKYAVAALLAAPLGQRLFRIARADIPHAPHERLALARLCDRELALANGLLLVTGDGKGDEEERAAVQFVDMLSGPTIILARDALPLERRRRFRADMPAGTADQRRTMWARALGPAADAIGEDAIDRLAGQFALDSAAIRVAVDLAQDATHRHPDMLADRLWDAARAQARRRLDDLAERIDGKAGWDDLVLPADRLAQVRDIAVHVRRAHQVHEGWGWSRKDSRGLGVTALFAGPSGTGKTMAAEVIANELRLDLYRIDLSQVVSKYIGETEKNLRRIFEAAEASGAILLFDEADALFGKRSEVKDSHDRYANVEISYLLQRMEAYRGLAILTTNLKSALDGAFMRRLRFVIDFPFPDVGLREEIWRRIFPADTPVSHMDASRLARLAIAGGAIRTIAINAAFLAAEEGGAVDQSLILAAARREYAKLDKPITTAEFGGGA